MGLIAKRTMTFGQSHVHADAGVQDRALGLRTVLVHSPYCTVREQEEQDLFYSTRTDEMHLISKSGRYVYELCDGLATIGDIENALYCALGADRATLQKRLMEFLEALVERGLLVPLSGSNEGEQPDVANQDHGVDTRKGDHVTL